MKIETYKVGLLQTNTYLLLDKEREAGFLIEAPQGIRKELGSLIQSRKLQLKGILITHGHWDHVGDVAYFQEENVTIYAHEGDLHLLKNPMIAADYMPPGMSIPPITIDHSLKDGEVLNLLDQEIHVLHTPGHTPGNVSFYIPSLNCVFVGDLLFAGSVGRTDFPGGSFSLLEKSIKEKIYTLPDETIIYPGHGPSTTVKREKHHNPYVFEN
ncbi:MAG: hypothetical protein A2007_02130 [Verrucomicrobia bacterium GWC2_42_7]|nr:MAG: hypothetical protein A2007_02130 [Verrucomicrobia bacterium GWC2_42_7]